MEENTSLFSLSIDPITKAHLSETARWARFLAIFGLVFLVLVVAIVLYSTLMISRYEDILAGNRSERSLLSGIGAGVVAMYVIMAAVAFFPLLFMLRFANQMRNALAGNDQALLNSSFQNLKIYFRYLGIVTIMVLVLTMLSVFMGILGRSL